MAAVQNWRNRGLSLAFHLLLVCITCILCAAKDERRSLGQVCELVLLTSKNMKNVMDQGHPGATVRIHKRHLQFTSCFFFGLQENLKLPLEFLQEELTRCQASVKGTCFILYFFLFIDRFSL